MGYPTLSWAALAALLAGGTALAEPGGCSVLTAPLPAGAFVTVDVTERVPCQGAQPALPLRYDRSAKASVATDAIPTGTYLGRSPVAPAGIAGAGERLRLVVRSGPVTIQRDVETLQAARAGTPAFVRTADGDVLLARFVTPEVTP